jgi:hypothetical protein
MDQEAESSEIHDESFLHRSQLRIANDRINELEKALEDCRRKEGMISKLHETTIDLMQNMQRSHDEANAVLTSRIKSLEDIVEPYRKEAADAAETREQLAIKIAECEELVCSIVFDLSLEFFL